MKEREKKGENSLGLLVTQPTLALMLIEDDCSLSLSVGSCVFFQLMERPISRY